MPHDQVVTLALDGIDFGGSTWSSWCTDAKGRGIFPLFDARQELGERIAEEASSK